MPKLLGPSSCSLLFSRGASSDSSTPAKHQRSASSPCGFPAMSTAWVWLTTCSITSAGWGCCSTWVLVRLAWPWMLPQSLGYVPRRNPGRHSHYLAGTIQSLVLERWERIECVRVWVIGSNPDFVIYWQWVWASHVSCLPAGFYRAVVPGTCRTRTSCAVFGTSDGTWF